jgi:hypothetical protein
VAKAKRIDWKRARAAQDDLRRLAHAHPELLGTASAPNRAAWEAVLSEDEMAATKMVAFRLTTDMVKRLDAHAARLKAMTGLEVTRADVVKLLLGRGLDVVEREAKSAGRPSRQ